MDLATIGPDGFATAIFVFGEKQKMLPAWSLMSALPNLSLGEKHTLSERGYYSVTGSAESFNRALTILFGQAKNEAISPNHLETVALEQEEKISEIKVEPSQPSWESLSHSWQPPSDQQKDESWLESLPEFVREPMPNVPDFASEEIIGALRLQYSDVVDLLGFYLDKEKKLYAYLNHPQRIGFFLAEKDKILKEYPVSDFVVTVAVFANKNGVKPLTNPDPRYPLTGKFENFYNQVRWLVTGEYPTHSEKLNPHLRTLMENVPNSQIITAFIDLKIDFDDPTAAQRFIDEEEKRTGYLFIQRTMIKGVDFVRLKVTGKKKRILSLLKNDKVIRADLDLAEMRSIVLRAFIQQLDYKLLDRIKQTKLLSDEVGYSIKGRFGPDRTRLLEQLIYLQNKEDLTFEEDASGWFSVRSTVKDFLDLLMSSRHLRFNALY